MARTPRTSLRRVVFGAALAAILALSACSSDAADENSPTASDPATLETTVAPNTEQPATSATTQGAPSPASPTPGRDADLAVTEFKLQWNDAVNVANGRFSGKLTEVGLDWEISQWAYAVELVSDTEEYDVKIGAMDGTILKEETGSLDDDDSRDDVFDPASVIELRQAKDAALASVAGRITEWKLEGSDGKVFFEFQILADGDDDETDVHVDATNATVVEID